MSLLITKENLELYVAIQKEIEERCEAFIPADYHLTNFFIDGDKIDIYSEDSRQEPFTDHVCMLIELFCNEQHYLLAKTIRDSEIRRMEEVKKQKRLAKEKEEEEKARALYKTLHGRFGHESGK